MGRIGFWMYFGIMGAVAGWMFPAMAGGVELYIPAAFAKPANSFTLPVMVDQIDNLAGMKLVLKYDAGLLTFKRGSKTRHTDELMHVVNDRTPGLLIIVMAGARGIKGKDIPLFTLTFVVNESVSEAVTTRVEITENQLMSDKLNVIECSIRTEPVTISP
jgi:hypothetical protein